VADRPADVVALDGKEAEAGLQRRKRGREPGRSASHDQQVELRVAGPARLGAHRLQNPLDALPALLERVPDEAHAPELAHDVQARHVGLEVLSDTGNVDAPLLGAEHELNGVHRTGALAQAVADAASRADDLHTPIDQPENFIFRAHVDAAPGEDAAGGVDHGVEADRLVQSVPQGLHLGLARGSFALPLA
jgi:hypothetical protein